MPTPLPFESMWRLSPIALDNIHLRSLKVMVIEMAGYWQVPR